MLSRCSLSSCEGFLKQGLLVTSEGFPAQRVCGPCVLGCLDRVCILEEISDTNTGCLVQTGNVFMINPVRWSKTFVRLKLECSPSTIDLEACNFIRDRIAHLLTKHKNTSSVTSFLSSDAKTLFVKDTLQFLIPNGLSKQFAICVDAAGCELCGAAACHYQVQCDECSQFTCGTWIRLKGTCAFCRHNMPR